MLVVLFTGWVAAKFATESSGTSFIVFTKIKGQLESSFSKKSKARILFSFQLV